MAKKSNKGKKAAPAAAPAAAAPAAAPTVYVLPASPNSHGVLCLLKENKIELAIKELDIMAGETKKPEFVAKNPFHCCPTIEDGDLILWESHAVMRYLCNKHKLDQWYPQSDLWARAKVEQALDWRHTSFYPALAKVVYPLFGFGAVPDAITGAANVAALKTAVGALESFYLKDGKFMGGMETPTIADLSMMCLGFLSLCPEASSPVVEAYMARVAAAVPSYEVTSASLRAWLASLAKPAAAAPAAKAPKKVNSKKGSNKKNNKKSSNKEKKKKKGGKAPAAKGPDPKKVKACIKEGGKKGQDLGGMSTFGCHYFLTTMIEPDGDMALLELCMQGANQEVDPEGEDRKGGAGDLAKVFFSAGEKTLSMICHVPKECPEASAADYFAACLVPVSEPVVVAIDEHMLKCEVQGNPEKGVFPLKLRDECIARGFDFLRSKNLILDDDSDDDTNYADAAGVDLNGGAGGDY